MAQGHLGPWLGSDRTSDLPVARQPAVPPERTAAPLHTLEWLMPNAFLRPVPGAERGAAGVGRVLQGQGEGARERARRVQRVQRLPGGAAQTLGGGGAHGYGPRPQGGRGQCAWQGAQSVDLKP